MDNIEIFLVELIGVGQCMKTRKVIYTGRKVKIRFISNGLKQYTSEQVLKAILHALWDESDRQDVIATVDKFVDLLNKNRVFFYPFPLDDYKSGFLIKYMGGCYQVFPWDAPDEDVHPLCETCRDWDFSKILDLIKPFFMQGQAHGFLCPNCHNIVVDDWAAEKAGATFWLTKKQFKERYGADGHDEPIGIESIREKVQNNP